MSNIRYLEGQCDLFWNSVKDDFAGFERPRIFPASAIRRDAPMYMRRYIDADPNSFYMFLAGDPLKHQDISRDKACEFFDRFFYEHMRMPSSFDVEAGGEYSREQAIDKEVLPARDDSAYQTYAQEQEELARRYAEEHEQNDAEDRWEQEHGFRRDDPDIIDVTDDSRTNTAQTSSSRAVGQAAGTAVGMPRKLFYAVDFRISAGGNQLGYDRGSHRLSGGRRSSGYLREENDLVPAGKYKFTADVSFINLAGTDWYREHEREFVMKNHPNPKFDKLIPEDGDQFVFAFDHEPTFDEIRNRLASMCKAKWGIAPYEYIGDECATADISPDYVDSPTVITDDPEWATDPTAWDYDMTMRLYPKADSADYVDYSKKSPNGVPHVVDGKSGIKEQPVLNESESDEDEVLAQLAELVKKAKKDSGLRIELEKVYDKFAGTNECEIDEDAEEETSECEKCGDDDCKAGEKCGMTDESVDNIKVVPDDDYDTEAEYNSSLPPDRRKVVVRKSEWGDYDDSDEDGQNEDEELDESLVQYVNGLTRERN